jgi:hypothetical protein
MQIEYCLLWSSRVVGSIFTNLSKEPDDSAVYPDEGGSRLNILNHRYTFDELHGDSCQRSATESLIAPHTDVFLTCYVANSAIILVGRVTYLQDCSLKIFDFVIVIWAPG